MRLDDHRKCGHGKVFNKRCIKCEIVSLNALIRRSRENIDRWTKEIDALNARDHSQGGATDEV